MISKDPAQFASQVVGRLLLHEGAPAIERFSAQVAKGAPAPWIRRLKPTLHPPGASLIRTLEGHSGWVLGVAVSRGGRRAVSASWDRTLKVWDLESGAALATFTCDAAVYSCAFIDDHKLIAGDALGCVHLLSIEESKPNN